MNHLRRITLLALVATLALVSSAAVVSAGPGTGFGKKGAIFTTNEDCSAVNLNQYELNEDVYLSGGPKKPGSASLSDGAYYVKVTEPNGTLLGTSLGSGDETPFVVADDGETVDCDQLASILVKASDGTPGFDLTGNPGGVYKVWVCKADDFRSRECKTDNFKSNEEADDPGNGEEPDPT